MRFSPLFVGLALFLAAASAQAYTFQSTGLYRAYDELAGWAADLQSQNPNLVRVVEYGQSFQGRPLLAINITVNPAADDPAKPDFLFTGGIHAREVIGSEAMLKLAENLVNGFRGGNASYQSMLSTRDVWIIPQQNPDGRVFVEQGQSAQRKNMHCYPGQNESNLTCGVDLNRNYPHKWELGAVNSLVSEYHGPSVLSEPESNSLWTLVHDKTKFSDLRASIDFHGGAAMVSTPWLSPSEFAASPLPAADRQKFDSLAARISQISGLVTSRLGYNLYGSLADSLYGEFGSYSMLEEIWLSNGDYFETYNPVTSADRDASTGKAVNSALFLLSDEAFAVPEPGTLLLCAMAGGLIWLRHVASTRRAARHARRASTSPQPLILPPDP